MIFDPTMRRRMETSFPSKLVEFAQFGKPIIVWGPEYCSAVRWARTGAKGHYTIDPSPTTLINALGELKNSQTQSNPHLHKTKNTTRADFDSHAIKLVFLERISNLRSLSFQNRQNNHA